ncbi:hypothetical protein Prudu_1051S000100 [Prunus dulcis]|uniref:F-box family protein with DUF295 n=1 Tax=Prunus dulcis TaxID=3755 RepID=A0A5H2XNK5_PRUDU|nr:hypothetical protein Prudu_1051S000100 [Prunus dulcis]
MKSDRCLRTSSLIIVQSVHLTLPHEFRGRSDRECQDLRLGRLGVPRPARIADQADYGPCILPERLELTWCHRGICRRDRLIISNEVLKDFELSLFKDDFQPFYIGLSVIAHVVEVHRIHHRATLNLHASKSVGWKYLRLFTSEILGLVKIQGRLCEFSAEV